MHGATPAFSHPKSPRIHLRTAHGRALPYPATYRQAVFRRTRTSLVLGGLLVTLTLYYLLRDSTSTGSHYLPTTPHLRADVQEAQIIILDNATEGKFITGARVPEKVAKQFHLEDLPVKVPVHPNPKPPLARDSVFTDPWPDKPGIAKLQLSKDKLANVPMNLPNWPVQTEQGSKRKPKFSKIPWEGLYRPEGYKGPVGLEDLPSYRSEEALQSSTFEETDEDIAIRRARQDWVKRAFLHAWGGYKSKAWGHDEVRPVTGHSSNGFNGWGATIVDSLSTLLLLNLTEEYSLARTHVRQIDFTTISGEKSVYGQLKDSRTVPVFETIIRYLGGLLSAYDLSGGDPLMLERAEDLAGWLIGAFDTRYGLPQGRYQLGTKLDGKYAGRQALAEVGSFSLEFGRLAQITGKSEYYDIIHRATAQLSNGWKQGRGRGALLPTHVDDSQPDNLEGVYSLGALTDSYYEYLLKAAMLFRNATASSQFADAYTAAIDSAYENGLIQDVEVVPGEEELIVIGQLKYETYMPTLEHLACYAGGMLAMGSKLLQRPKDLKSADGFTQTCFWAYNSSWTGIGPEVLTFYRPMDVRRYIHEKDASGQPYLKVGGTPPGVERGDKKAQSRPETIESIFYMWRITGDPVWQERGWTMFTNWVRYSIAPYGFSGINNVNSARYRQTDSMESFVLAETLKYYYLLFSDPDFLSLDEYVFNTEAHPLQLPLGGSQEHPKLFIPTWQHTALDEQLRELYDDPLEMSNNTTGTGTWVQKQLALSAFPKQN